MKYKPLLVLHLLLLFYSVSGVFSKLAAGKPFLSPGFLLCYGAVVLILFVYAVGWQQIIRQMPLSTAFANKAVTTIWGTVWGMLLFHEGFSAGKMLGIILIVAGIIIYTGEGTEENG